MDTLIAWLQAVIQWLQCVVDTIICVVVALADFLLHLLLYIPRQVFAYFGQGIVGFFGLLPVPSFISDLQGLLSSIGSVSGYLLVLFKINYGISVILGAYVLRFIIRRIPGIG